MVVDCVVECYQYDYGRRPVQPGCDMLKQTVTPSMVFPGLTTALYVLVITQARVPHGRYWHSSAARFQNLLGTKAELDCFQDQNRVSYCRSIYGQLVRYSLDSYFSTTLCQYIQLCQYLDNAHFTMLHGIY